MRAFLEQLQRGRQLTDARRYEPVGDTEPAFRMLVSCKELTGFAAKRKLYVSKNSRLTLINIYILLKIA